MDRPTLTVVGLGVGSETHLSDAARAALDESELVIGSKRQLAALPALQAECVHYPSPFSDLWTLLEQWAGRRVALLASGDPLLCGIGATLVRRLGPERIAFHPAVSSVQVAFARIGRSWSEAEIVSLHGRPLTSLRASLRNNRLYAIFTDARSHPLALAELLTECGYGDSTLWVLEDLGTPAERITSFRAEALPARPFSPLNVVVVETRGSGRLLPEFPGIPDERFSTDGEQPGSGMISKREVRLAILSLLESGNGDVGWDVGAGCGAVAVEWARWNPGGRVLAVESDPNRVHHIEVNRDRFGVVANLEVHLARAPEALETLPNPNAVFVGGGGRRLPELLNYCWQRLERGGRLVASAVTEESRACLAAFARDKDAELSQLAVARGASLGDQRLLRPLLPVLLLKRTKA